MPACLVDVNVWLGVAFEAHPAHDAARSALQRCTADQPALWCRATQQSFLRLATTTAIFTAYGVEKLTNRDALAALEVFLQLPQVDQVDEPPDLMGLWCRLAGLDQVAPKRWMDAYLAAFAIAGSIRLISLDRDFLQFQQQGLDVELLTPS